MRKLEFGFEQQASDIGNLNSVLTAHFPSQVYNYETQSFIPLEETYGKDFMRANPEERRVIMNKRKEDELKKEFSDVYATGSEDSGGAVVGNIFGALSSPTVLAPIGSTYKAATAIGALLGLEMNALDQKVKTGEIDAEELAIATVASAVISPVVLKIGRQASKGLSNRKERLLKKGADKAVDQINTHMARAVAEGVPKKEISKYVQNATGLSKDDLTTIAIEATKKPHLPSLEEAKMILGADVDSVARSSDGAFDKLFGIVSTRVGLISPLVKQKLRNMDMDIHVKTHESREAVKPFMKLVNSVPRGERANMNQLLHNGKFEEVAVILEKINPDARNTITATRKILRNQFTELKKAGYKDIKEVENYFPRMVKDKKGLFAAIGKPMVGRINNALKERQQKLGVENLSEAEESRVINNVLAGYVPVSNRGGLSATKSRTINEVDADLSQYYADPLEALDRYIRSTTKNIETRKFFGANAKSRGDQDLRFDESIDNLVNKELKGLLPEDQDSLRTLLNARFVNGEKGPSAFIGALKNIGYMSSLANPVSTLTQVADLAVSAWTQGTRNTIAALMSPRKGISARDFGLMDTISAELDNAQMLAKALQKSFKYSLFSKVDNLGKTTLLNAALRKGEKFARSPKGIAKLRRKYGESFGSDFENLVTDLKAGKVTPNTKAYLWSELADVQPIALTELPEVYLNNPNGRVAYMMKSFMLKQVDALRREVVHSWKRGEKKESIEKAITYSLIVPTANMTVSGGKQLMLGRDTSIQNIEDVPEEWALNTLKIFGGSEYLANQIFEGNILGAVANTVAPPMDVFKHAINTLTDASKGEVNTKLLSSAPVFGRFWDNWFEGGLEKHNKKIRKKIYE